MSGDRGYQRVHELVIHRVLVAEGHGAARTPGQPLLVLDDEPLVRYTLEAALRQNGYQVVQAGDGDEALDVLAAARVDLVLTDLVMPRREGIETIIEIRRRFPATAA